MTLIFFYFRDGFSSPVKRLLKCRGNELGPLCWSLGHGRWDQCLGLAPCGLRRAYGALSAISAGLCWGVEIHQGWKTSFFAFLLRQLDCWFLRVKLMEINSNLFSSVIGDFVQGFSWVTSTINLTAGNLLWKRSQVFLSLLAEPSKRTLLRLESKQVVKLKKSNGKSKDDEPISRRTTSVSESPWYYRITLSRLS